MASSTRIFFSFISLSVAPPTLILATPPDSLAIRSLQLLLVVVAGGLLQLASGSAAMRPLMASFLPAPSMIVVLSLSILTFLARPRSLELDVLELDAQVLEDRLAAGQDGDVLEHGLAAVAVAGGLDGAALERAAQLVDDQRRQGLALDFLGDDQDRLALAERPSPAPGPGPCCELIFFS